MLKEIEAQEQRGLAAIQQAYKSYSEHGARSNKKLLPLHGWVKRELRQIPGPQYTVVGMTESSSRERAIDGLYHRKNVDVCVLRDGIELGVVSIKFIISSYEKNAINYLEHQMGETANLRRKDIVYGHIFCITEPIPTLNKDGLITKTESIRGSDIQRYLTLATDHGHALVPDVQALCIFHLEQKSNTVDRICIASDLANIDKQMFSALRNNLSLGHFFEKFASLIRSKYMLRGVDTVADKLGEVMGDVSKPNTTVGTLQSGDIINEEPVGKPIFRVKIWRNPLAPLQLQSFRVEKYG